MKAKYIVLDFEYNGSENKVLNVLSCVTRVRTGDKCETKRWLKDTLQSSDGLHFKLSELPAYLEEHKQTHKLVTFQALAEGSAMLSLGMDLHGWNILDLWTEEKLIKNCDILDKTIKVSLLETARRYGVMPDEYKQVKTDTRDIILRGEPFTHKEIDEILFYNELDVTTTEALIKPIMRAHRQTYGVPLNPVTAQLRGEYTFKLAYMERAGIPVHRDVLYKVLDKSLEIKRYYVERFEDVKQCFQPVVGEFKFKEDRLAQLIEEKGLGHLWVKTKTGKYGKDKDWLNANRSVHPFIEELATTMNNLAALRYISGTYGLTSKDTVESVYQRDVVAKGYKEYINEEGKVDSDLLSSTFYPEIDPELIPKTPKGKLATGVDALDIVGVHHKIIGDVILASKRIKHLIEKSGEAGGLADALGDDDRIRYYPNMYGSRTGRNQPPSSRFFFLQSAWQRCFTRIPKGKKLVAIDFSQQEQIVGASLGKDGKMLKSALSDSYLGFAKDAGLAPPDATKETHKEIRNMCKAIVLGVCYGKQARSMASEIFPELPEKQGKKKAQDLINMHRNTYTQYWEMVEEFATKRYTPFLFGDWGAVCVTKKTSSYNYLMQAGGALVMRDIVRQLVGRTEIVALLHDGYYYLLDEDEDPQWIVEIMQETAGRVLGLNPKIKVPVDVETFVHGQIMLEKAHDTFELLANLIGLQYEKQGKEYFWA